jgi:pilus assembly protein CpaE
MDNAHILVVDDSEMIIYKLKAILIRLGYKVTTFTNSVNALEWLKTPGNVPNLILSDLMMPEMNGVDFVKSIRQLPQFTQTPIIMLTTQTEIEDKITGLQAGADDYLGKTVSATELDLRVRALLLRSQDTETNFSQSVAKTISVFSLRGGVGTTSIAVNLSVAVSQLWGIDVCLWDMSLTGGHCASLLNLRPKNTPAYLNDWPEGPIEETILAQMITEHETGIKLMPAPLTAAEAELVTPRVVDLILPYLQGHFAFLVVDAGNHFTEPVLNILERSDVILLVLAPEIASLKSANDALKIFDDLGYDLNKVILVINNTFPKFSLPVKKILPTLKNLPAVEIPYDSDRMIKAILTGEPLITTAPKSDVGLAFITLAYKLSSQQMESKKKTPSSSMLDAIHKLIPDI